MTLVRLRGFLRQSFAKQRLPRRHGYDIFSDDQDPAFICYFKFTILRISANTGVLRRRRMTNYLTYSLLVTSEKFIAKSFEREKSASVKRKVTVAKKDKKKETKVSQVRSESRAAAKLLRYNVSNEA